MSLDRVAVTQNTITADNDTAFAQINTDLGRLIHAPSAVLNAWNQLRHAPTLKPRAFHRDASRVFFASSRADQPTRSRFEIVNRFKFLSLSGVRVASASWEQCAEPTRIGNYVDDQSAGMTWPPWSPHTDSAVSATAAHLTTGRDAVCLAGLIALNHLSDTMTQPH